MLPAGIDLNEAREWLFFAFILISTIIALLTYYQSIKQSKLENALLLLNRFENRFRGNDAEQFRRFVRLSYEGIGAVGGAFVLENGELWSFENLFTEGTPDGGAFIRIMDGLENISYEWNKHTISRRYVYYSIGHLLNFCHYHLTEALVLPSDYYWPQFQKVMRKSKSYRKKWTYRSLAMAEDALEVYDSSGQLLYNEQHLNPWDV